MPKAVKQEANQSDVGLIMAMAGEMASIMEGTRKACAMFKVLAISKGVDVENAFKSVD